MAVGFRGSQGGTLIRSMIVSPDGGAVVCSFIVNL